MKALGLTHKQIALALGPPVTPNQVERVFRYPLDFGNPKERRYRRKVRAKAFVLKIKGHQEVLEKVAEEALQREIRAARAERATAPLYKTPRKDLPE